MWIDVSLAVFLGAVTLYMAYLGVHVTLHPTKDARTRRRYKLSFLACAAVAVTLIAVQTARNAQTQSAIRKQLSDIEHNTMQAPTVTVQNTVPPAQVIFNPSRQETKPKTVDNEIEDEIKRRRALAVGASPGGWVTPESSSFPTSEIQGKLGEFIKQGIILQRNWKSNFGKPEDIQNSSAEHVQQWDSKIEEYLESIPRGSVYVARFNIAVSVRSWPC